MHVQERRTKGTSPRWLVSVGIGRTNQYRFVRARRGRDSVEARTHSRSRLFTGLDWWERACVGSWMSEWAERAGAGLFCVALDGGGARSWNHSRWQTFDSMIGGPRALVGLWALGWIERSGMGLFWMDGIERVQAQVSEPVWVQSS
jgi:hypothetical protein